MQAFDELASAIEQANAEIRQLRQELIKVHNQRRRLIPARAAIQRIWELCDKADRQGDDWISKSVLRAALADPKGTRTG